VKSVLALMSKSTSTASPTSRAADPRATFPRPCPRGSRPLLEERAWTRPAVFDWLQRTGRIERDEMHRTFNCGLGMTITVGRGDAERALGLLRERGEQARSWARSAAATAAP